MSISLGQSTSGYDALRIHSEASTSKACIEYRNSRKFRFLRQFRSVETFPSKLSKLALGFFQLRLGPNFLKLAILDRFWWFLDPNALFLGQKVQKWQDIGHERSASGCILEHIDLSLFSDCNTSFSIGKTLNLLTSK